MYVMSTKGIIFLKDCLQLLKNPDLPILSYSYQEFLKFYNINYNQFLYICIINGTDYINPVSLARIITLKSPDGQVFEDSINYMLFIKDYCFSLEDIFNNYTTICKKENAESLIRNAFSKYNLSSVNDFPNNIFPNIHNANELQNNIGISQGFNLNERSLM